MTDTESLRAETLARRFHETYERLAPSFGWHTMETTRTFDPNSPNGRLMIATCAEILATPESTALARLEAAERVVLEARAIGAYFRYVPLIRALAHYAAPTTKGEGT